jgi:hypothetical protein
MTLEWYIEAQHQWSLDTFGEGDFTESIIKHIEKELSEIRNAPDDLFEWVDVAKLAIEGARRRGFTAEQIIEAFIEKQEINQQREWPEHAKQDEPTEHIRN